MSSQLSRFLVLALVGTLVIAGCSGDGSTGTDNGTDNKDDTISIETVTPNSGLTPDVSTDFVVNIEYELASADSGELSVGFNSVEVGRYQMIVEAKVFIAKGSGEHQFNVTVFPKNWGAAGDFVVYVNLSEYPHGPSWTPLATDIRVLTF
jgi:hypothetical protein